MIVDSSQRYHQPTLSGQFKVFFLSFDIVLPVIVASIEHILLPLLFESSFILPLIFKIVFNASLMPRNTSQHSLANLKSGAQSNAER